MEALTNTDIEPLFKNATEAVTFAFNFSNQQYARSLMANMMQRVGAIGTGKGLVGLDGAAQAAMVLCELDRLEVYEQAAITARSARSRVECPCCLQEAMSPERAAAIRALATYTVVAIPGISHMHLRRAMVSKYFGIHVDLQGIAKRCGVARSTAYSHYSPISESLRFLENKAQANLEDRLQLSGMVEKSS